MGIFKKKKEQTGAAQVSQKRFAVFDRLSDADWDKRKLIKDLQAQWDICVVEGGKQQDDTLVFQVGKMIATVGLMPVPVPGNEAEENARSNYLWQGATEAAHNHRAHLIVAVMGTEPDVVEQGILFVKLLSSCCSQKGVLGIYSSGTVFEPRFYEGYAQIIKKNGLSVLNWIWFGLWQRGSGICCYTYGMSAFGKDEMEVLDADAKPSDVRDFLLNMAAYVLESDVILNDGETIGFSAEDRHLITRSEGAALPGTTLKIEY